MSRFNRILLNETQRNFQDTGYLSKEIKQNLDHITQKNDMTLSNSLISQFLKEQSIHSDPNEIFKRRTIKIDRIQHIFGFDLHSLGLLNLSTKQIEYLYYVSKIYEDTAAYFSGLRIGDVLLGIDGIRIENFKDLNKIIAYLQEKDSIRLITLSESISKKIDYQKRVNNIQRNISEKLKEYNNLCQEEEALLRKMDENKNDIETSSIHSLKSKNTKFPSIQLSKSMKSTPMFLSKQKCDFNDSCDETAEWIITRL